MSAALKWSCVMAVVAVLAGVWPPVLAATQQENVPEQAPAESFRLTSPAFKNGETIPMKHSGEGVDVSPALKWTQPPIDTKSFALIVEDPDAPMGTWIHWVIFNIPADKRELPEAVPALDKLPDGSLQGLNDFKKVGYNGPMPPPGKPHRYFFRLYALDVVLELSARATAKELREAMTDHVLAEAGVMGMYQR